MGLLPDAAGEQALVSLGLLLLGTVLAVYALRERRWEVPAVAVATAGVVGWYITGANASAVLLVVVKGKGLHVGDLLVVPAAVLVLWLSLRGARR